MSRGRRALGSALGALLATSVLTTAERRAAADASSGAGYTVDASCPSRQRWLAALGARLPPLLRSHPLIEALSVHIEEVRAGDGVAFEGALEPLPGAPETGRSVRGASCAEVVDALSFIAALSLERAARVSAASAAPDASSPPPPVDPPLAAPRAGAFEADGSDTQLGAVGHVSYQGRLVPGSSVAIGGALRLSWSTPGWQPLLLLGAYVGVPEEHALGGGRVRFEHWGTRAVGCPWRFPALGMFGLRPCLELDVGRVSGEGRGLSDGSSRAAPWIGSGAQLRAELRLGRWLELGAGLSATVPLYHSRFFLRPDLTSFETPALGYRAEAYTSVLF